MCIDCYCSCVAVLLLAELNTENVLLENVRVIVSTYYVHSDWIAKHFLSVSWLLHCWTTYVWSCRLTCLQSSLLIALRATHTHTHTHTLHPLHLLLLCFVCRLSPCLLLLNVKTACSAPLLAVGWINSGSTERDGTSWRS